MKIIVLSFLLLLSYKNIKSQCEAGNLLPYESKGKYGYIDREENVVIKAKYDDIGMFKTYDNKEIGIVKKDDKYRILDIRGKSINNKKYEEILGVERLTNLIKAKRRGKIRYVNLSGKEVEGFGFLTCGLMNREEKLLPKIEKLEDGRYVVKLIGQKVLRTSVNYKFDSLTRMSIIEVLGERAVKVDTIKEELDVLKIWKIKGRDVSLQVWKSGKTGLMRSEGEIILPMIYDKIGTVSNIKGWNYSYIWIKSKEGIINEQGEIMVEPLERGIAETNISQVCNPIENVIRIRDRQGVIFYYDLGKKKIIGLKNAMQLTQRRAAMYR